MKDLFKPLPLIAGICLLANSLFGQATYNAAVSLGVAWGTNAPAFTTAAYPGSAGVGTNIVPGGALVTSIIIYNPTDTAVDVAFIDAPPTNNALVRGATYWTNLNNLVTVTNALATLTNTVVTFAGVTQTIGSATLWNFTGFVTNTIKTNCYSVRYFVRVPPATIITPPLGAGMLVGNGLNITNGFVASMGASNIVVSVNYNPSL